MATTLWTLSPWGSPGKNTGVDCHLLLQGIFPTQDSNPHLLCLPHWQVGSLPLVPPGKPRIILCNTKTKSTKGQKNESDLIKIKNFYSANRPIKKTRWSAMDWEMPAKHMSDKGLVSRITDMLKLKIKKTKAPTRKWAERHSSPRSMQLHGRREASRPSGPSVCMLSGVRLLATPWSVVALLSPRNFPGKNTGVGSHSLLQWIFLTQGSKPGLLHYRQILYCLSHQGSPS